MTAKIFRAIFFVVFFIMSAAMLVMSAYSYEYVLETKVAQLKNDLYLISNAVEQTGIEYLEDIDSNKYRITWIEPDGDILFDSHIDSDAMVNHLQREEIKEAIANNSGSSIRYSETTGQKMIYEAEKLPDDTILRIAVTKRSSYTILLDLIKPMLIIYFTLIIISVITAKRISGKITHPLNTLNLDYPLDNNTYEELSPILNRLSRQNRRIDNKINELKQKTDEFQFITESMNEGIILLDSNKKILSMNIAAAKYIGIEGKCIGKIFTEIQSEAEINVAVEKAFGIGNGRVRVKKKECEYQFDISRIEKENGQTVGAVLLAFDVTEQANAERMRREFSANVSHELKTPLQTIMGSAELIENNLVESKDIPKFIRNIKKESQRLLSLIQDIIRLSQLDEGEQLPKENIQLDILVKDIFETLSETAKEKNIKLIFKGNNIEFYGVKHLVYEIFYNLCDNAVKYNKENGSVTVEITEQSNEIFVKITDTGIGIPVEHQSRIFERFYRVDKSHSKKSGGTGLGLSIVKHAVMYHNGNVTLESILGKGTIVTLIFKK